MSCSYYSFKNNDFYCMKKEDYVNSDTYYKYCKNWSYDECPVYKHEESSGCYLTTIVCNILNKKDNDSVLNTMRVFRDNVLQQDSNYFEILCDYDMIGPKIADAINNDRNRFELANLLYSNSLVAIQQFIIYGENELAIECYRTMTDCLIERYNLREEYDNMDRDSYTFIQGKSGHGKCLKRVN